MDEQEYEEQMDVIRRHAGQTPSGQQYQTAMEMLYANGQWYRFPKWLLKIEPQGQRLKPGVAHTLAALLDQSSFQKAACEHGGWFSFNHELAEEQTGYCEREQCYHIKALIDVGLIDRRRAQELHGKRELKINYEELVRLLCKVCRSEPVTHAKIAGVLVQSLPEPINIDADSITDRRRKRTSSASPLPSSEQNNTKKTSSAGSSGYPPLSGDLTSPELEDKFYGWYDFALDILRSKKNPSIALIQVHRKRGAEYIRTLWKELGQDDGRIQKFLEAYQQAIHRIDRPIPSSIKQLFSAQIFNWLEQEVFADPNDVRTKDGKSAYRNPKMDI